MRKSSDASPSSLRAVPLEEVRKARGNARVPVPRSKLASTRAFRRVRADRALGILGILLILFSLYLIFNWDRPLVVEPSFTVDWDESPQSISLGTLSLLRDSPTLLKPFEIQDVNLTRVALTVQWKDDVGDETIEYDTLTFNLSSPPPVERHQSISGTADHINGQQLSLTLVLNEPPNVRRVEAKTEAEAFESLGDQTNRNGTGTWNLQVELVRVVDDFKTNASRALETCPENSPPQVCIPDLGQSVEAKIEYWTYRTRLTPNQ